MFKLQQWNDNSGMRFFCLIFCGFTFTCFELIAQNISLSGIVIYNGQAIEFVNIGIPSLGKGAVTDQKGSFIINNIPTGKYEVVISFVGFEQISDSVEFSEQSIFKEYHLTETGLQLDEITIIDEQSGLNARTPYTVSTIKLDRLELKGNPSGIMGLLREEPGVNGAEMGQGIVKPFIRGLGFSRIVTIYQGNKLENHQWGADHGLGINDLGVNQIEVIKGPASILYGSGALGGVIIVKDTENYLKSNVLSLNSGFTYNSVSGGLRTNFSIGKLINETFFLAGDFAYENHADYKDGDNRIIGNSRFNTLTYRLHAGWNTANFKNKISYSYHKQLLGIIDDNEMIDSLSLSTSRYDRKTQLPYQNVSDHLVSYRQSVGKNKVFSTLNISHHLNRRNEIESGLGNIDLGLLQQHTFYNFRVSHKLSHTINQNFGFQGAFIINKNKFVSKEILIPDARVLENGFYYLIDFDFDKYFLQVGIRYDYRIVKADASAPHLVDYGFVLPGDPVNKKLKNIFQGATGSLGISRKLKEHNTIKLNFSTGYRAPDLAELYSNGPHPGTSRFEMGDASFRREQSFQGDLGWTMNYPKAQMTVSVYGGMVQNYIFFVKTDSITESGLEVWSFQQENALLYGTDFSLTCLPFIDDKLKISLQGSVVRGVKTSEDENLTFIPADNFRLSLNSSPFKKVKTSFSSSLLSVLTHKRPGFGEENTSGYVIWNMGVGHTLNVKSHQLVFGLNVNNLLNKTYFDHMSILRAFEINTTGRNVMLNLQYTF